MKPNINSAEVHPQLSDNGHPVDGALVGAASLWLCIVAGRKKGGKRRGRD